MGCPDATYSKPTLQHLLFVTRQDEIYLMPFEPLITCVQHGNEADIQEMHIKAIIAYNLRPYQPFTH